MPPSSSDTILCGPDVSKACLDVYKRQLFILYRQLADVVPVLRIPLAIRVVAVLAKQLSLIHIYDVGRLVVQREGGRTEALRCGAVTIRPTKTE